MKYLFPAAFAGAFAAWCLTFGAIAAGDRPRKTLAGAVALSALAWFAFAAAVRRRK